MADYGKVTASFVYSENSDFSDPIFDHSFESFVTTTTDSFQRNRVKASTGGATVTTSMFASTVKVAVQNLDPTNSVTVAFQNAAAVAQSQVLAAGEFLVSPDCLAFANITLTSSAGAPVCDVVVFGVE